MILDRMAVDEAAEKNRRPEAIAAEIHRQLGNIAPPIPVREIAQALDILDIQDKPLVNFEALLITDPERSSGSIAVNANSSSERRSYSLAHELAHFLCFWHRQTQLGFQCTRADMAAPSGDPVHFREEAEANTFAIELLAPSLLVKPHLRGLPDIERVLALHTKLSISKEAAARRYVELHPEPLAVVFAQNGIVRYLKRHSAFPYIRLQPGDPMPSVPVVPHGLDLSEMEEADMLDWCTARQAGELGVQVLRQSGGYATVLLHLANDE